MKHTSKMILSAFLITALLCGIVPQAWAVSSTSDEETKVDSSIELQADEVSATPGWELFGSCEWKINNGTLTIRPANKNEQGKLPDNTRAWPWSSNRKTIEQVMIEGHVVCGNSMTMMFFDCSSLVTADLSGLDTSNVLYMDGTFDYCSSLTTLDLSGFDTSNTKSMYIMFRYCTSLKSIDLSGFDTTNVYEFSGMFRGCESLTSLDLSNFHTPKATQMEDAFYNCSSLTTLDLSGFDTSNLHLYGNNFYGTSLQLIKLGENFTLQDELPGTWYNASGESFTQ